MKPARAFRFISAICALGASIGEGGALARPLAGGADAPIALELTVSPGEQVAAAYRLQQPVRALHFAQELGGYRSQDWTPLAAGFRWISEGDGERIERVDGKPFARLTMRIPLRYRALPKSYAPFSPFSEGSALIHSGQFHACPSTPCDGSAAIPIAVAAPGKTIGVAGGRIRDKSAFVSSEEGTNIFVGTLEPVPQNDLVAIVDPGLPAQVREHLARSLPRAISDFGEIYGPLSFRPELYVSIDDRRRDDGHISTQGGTLPGQIFMHFDGEGARERASKESPFWLDWFFAHEAAHLFQQDKVGKLAGDDVAAWIHEGGADAMAALDLAKRGADERAYVGKRIGSARGDCAKGLADMPLDQASARGQFDLHYQCGLLIWLALDRDLSAAGKDGLNAFNREYFARVRAGAPWDRPTFLAVAKELGVSGALLQRIRRIDHGGYADPQVEIDELPVSLAP